MMGDCGIFVEINLYVILTCGPFLANSTTIRLP